MRALEEPGKLYAVYIHHGRVMKDARPRFRLMGWRCRVISGKFPLGPSMEAPERAAMPKPPAITQAAAVRSPSPSTG